MQMRIYTIACVIFILCCFGDVTPAGCITWASEIMLDAVLEDVSLTLTIGFRILLGTQNDGFRAVFTINLIQCLVEPFHLLMPLSVVVDEVRLNTIIWTDAHDDDSSTLVVIALTENPLRASGSRLDDLLGRIGGGECRAHSGTCNRAG